MRHAVIVLVAVSCLSVFTRAQSAEELVNKNIQAKGGIDKINSATDKLTTASHKLAEAMYKAQSTGQNGAGAPSGDGAGAPETSEKPKDNVVDAEFTEVKDKKAG